MNLDFYCEGLNQYVRLVQLHENMDLTNYFNWLSDPDVVKGLEIRFQSNRHNIDFLRKYVREQRLSPNVTFIGIFIGSSVHIGNVRVEYERNHKRASIGFLLGEYAYRGKGIMTRTLQSITDKICLELPGYSIFAGCYSSNKESIKVLENSGFELVSIIPNFLMQCDVRVDKYIYEARN